MKKSLFILSILFFLKVSAQEPFYYHLKIEKGKNKAGDLVIPLDKEKSDKIITEDSLQKMLERMKMQRIQQGKLLLTQTNGTRIYVLPQDNMLCLVPDMTQFNMPNPANGKKITGMPPGSAPPDNILPEKKDN